MESRRCRVHATLLAILLSTAAYAQEADVARGEKLFESQCTVCHGQKGTGGRGPVLAKPKLEKAPDDVTLAAVISHGIQPEMPGAWQLSAREVGDVVKYVRKLGTVPPVVLPGDPKRGAALYANKGCVACHVVNGTGGGFGPELSGIGARRSAEHLRQSLTDPGAFIPEEYVAAEAVSANGRKITGLRANEDTFSLQIKTLDGRFHSFRKSEMKSAKSILGRSLMPSYRDTLQPAELDDLVAYLAGLRGRQ